MPKRGRNSVDSDKLIKLLELLENTRKKNLEAIINKKDNPDYLFGHMDGIKYCIDLLNYTLMD